jgi:hypothetical protein
MTHALEEALWLSHELRSLEQGGKDDSSGLICLNDVDEDQEEPPPRSPETPSRSTTSAYAACSLASNSFGLS